MKIQLNIPGKILAILLSFLLIFEQYGFAQVAGELNIAGHLAALHSSLIQDKFRPLHLRYLSYDAQANNFKLLLDKGSLKELNNQLLEDTTKDLLKYFFIGISLPNNSFWVNLRPDLPDNIIDDYLAQTDLGKIMLEADLQLKKDTAKATSPETPEGKLYWDKLYKKADELFGNENISIPTLTRPWIVPGEIIIRETLDSAYIYKATLKVMLEQDYLKDSAIYNFKDPRLKALNEYSSELIRERIIPKLNKEINSSRRYAALRQVYYSLILAQWFKARFYGKGGLYSSSINKKDLTNLISKQTWSRETYFKAYQKSFKEGEYNIQQPVYTPYGQSIRSYFSGGMQLMPKPEDLAPFGDPKHVSSPISALPASSSPVPKNNEISMIAPGTPGPEAAKIQMASSPEEAAPGALSPANKGAVAWLKQWLRYIKIHSSRTKPLNQMENKARILGSLLAEAAKPISEIYSKSERRARAHTEYYKALAGKKIAEAQVLWQEYNTADTELEELRPRPRDVTFQMPPFPTSLSDFSKDSFVTAIAEKIQNLKAKWEKYKREFDWQPFKGRESFIRNLIVRVKNKKLYASYYHGTVGAVLPMLRETEYLFLPADTLRDLGIEILWGEQELALATPGRTVSVTRVYDSALNYTKKSFNAPIDTDLAKQRQVLNEIREGQKNHPYPDQVKPRINRQSRIVELLEKNTEVIEEFNRYAYPIILGFYKVVDARSVPLGTDVPGTVTIGGFIDFTELNHIYVPEERIAFVTDWLQKTKRDLQERLVEIRNSGISNRETAELERRLGLLVEGIDNIEVVSMEEMGLFISHFGNMLYAREGSSIDRESFDEEWDESAINFLEYGLAQLENSEHKQESVSSPGAVTTEGEKASSSITNSIRDLTLYIRALASKEIDENGDVIIPQSNGMLMKAKLKHFIEMNGLPTRFGDISIKQAIELLQKMINGLLTSEAKTFQDIDNIHWLSLGDVLIIVNPQDKNMQGYVYTGSVPDWTPESYSFEVIPFQVNEQGEVRITSNKPVKITPTELRKLHSRGLKKAIISTSANIPTPMEQDRSVSALPISRPSAAENQHTDLRIDNERGETLPANTEDKPRPQPAETSVNDRTILGPAEIRACGEIPIGTEIHQIGMSEFVLVSPAVRGALSLINTEALKLSGESEDQTIGKTGYIERSWYGWGRKININRKVIYYIDVVRLSPLLWKGKGSPNHAANVFSDPEAREKYSKLGGSNEFFIEGHTHTKEWKHAEFLGITDVSGAYIDFALGEPESVQDENGEFVKISPSRVGLHAIIGISENQPSIRFYSREAVVKGMRKMFQVFGINFEYEHAYGDKVTPAQIDALFELGKKYKEDMGIVERYVESSKEVGKYPIGGSGSASSAIGDTNSEAKMQSQNIKPGGIDFRTLPIVTQAIGNLSVNISSSAINRLGNLNLNQEWQQIQKMLNAGIIPSAERLKEYVQVSCVKGDLPEDINKVILCISDILRQEEESYCSTDPVLSDMLVVLESRSSTEELKTIFTGTKL